MKVNVIIVGAVRDLVDLFLIIKNIDEARKSGVVEQVVLSTWKGDFAECSWVKKRLLQSGVVVVENSPIQEGGVGNIFRQQRALYSGLLFIENKKLPIIKCRTDKCQSLLREFLIFSKNSRGLIFDESGVFSRKIIIEMASMTVPFLVADKVFLSSYEDSLKLTFSSDIYDKEFAFGKHIGAENRWFSNLFLLKYPDFRYFFDLYNFRAVSTHIVNFVVENGFFENRILSFIARYFYALDKSFSFVRDPAVAAIDFLDRKSFLIERRSSRAEMHIKTQKAMDYLVDNWGESREIDFSGLNEFCVKNWLGKISVSSPEKYEDWVESVFYVLPVSAGAKSMLEVYWSKKEFSNLSAADIYYESASFLVGENQFLDDAVSLLRRGFKSKHIKCSKMLLELNGSFYSLDDEFLLDLRNMLIVRNVISE